MDHLERLAAAAGHRLLGLSVSLPSRGFCEHRGYAMLEKRSIDVGDGQRLDHWYAEKRIAREP